jgi:hypothetical protein
LFSCVTESILYAVRKMAIRSIIQGMVVAGLTLQLLLAVVLLAKKMWGKFPLFLVYSVTNLFEAIVLYILLPHRLAYFYTYVVFQTITIMLGVAVIYEIFKYLFSLYPGLRRVARLNLYVAVFILLLLAAAVLYAHAPIGKNGVVRAVLVAEEAARVLEVGLVTMLFAFSGLFGLHWRQPVFGITLGLGVFAVAKLLVLTVLPNVGAAGAQVVNLANAIGFDSSMLIWLGYMLVPERITSPEEMPQRAQLEQWNQAIMELINQ